MNYQYIIALAVLCALLGAGIYLMRYANRFKLFNLIFIALVFIPYVCMCIYVYKTDTDPTRWNFFNALPTANVSPFMFSVMPLLTVLPKKAREHLFLLVSLLCVGMFLSTVFGCVGNAVRSYRFHFHFMLDYLSHFALAAFGIFLVRTRQVTLRLKSCLISGSIIYGVATVMLIVNAIFDKAFFGLSLRGKHNIYNMVLVKSSALSAVLYFVGLGAVLLMGYAVCRLFSRERFRIEAKPED